MTATILSFDATNTRGWIKLPDNDPYNLLRKRWWGIQLHCDVDCTVLITDPVTPPMRIPTQIRSTNGQLFVRNEYEVMYKRLIKRHLLAPRKGVIVSGQPGIGKTVFLFYVLIRRLKKRIATLFYSPTTHVLLFQEDGTYRFSDLSQADEGTFSFGFDVWFLIDMDKGLEPPPPVITDASPWPVQAASPNEVRFKSWKKHRQASIFIMDPWSEEEMRTGLDIQTLGVSDSSLEQTKSIVSGRLLETIGKYGPVPRTVYDAAIAPVGHESNLDKALESLTYQDLFQAIQGAVTNPSTLSHQVILIRRDPCPRDELDEDSTLLDFVSDHVAMAVMQRLYNLEFRQAVTLMSLFRTSPETSTAGGWLFEALAHRVLTLNVPEDDWMSLPPLKQMKASRNTSRKYFVEVQEESSIGRRPQYLPLSRARLEMYSDINGISKVSDGQYLIPQRRNNPLFDSLMFATTLQASEPMPSLDSEPAYKRRRIEATTIYVLQMTTSPNYTGSEKGIHDLTKLQLAMPTIQFIYVLVVPRTTGTRSYTWEMPQGWKKVSGKVYCQEIPVASFHLQSIDPYQLQSTIGFVIGK